jgi:hypothetical protein
MAANTGNKRIPVKWVRDKAKAAYEKQSTCYICGTPEELELHHFSSVTLMLDAWAKSKNYNISTDEGILNVRDEFISEHHDELYNKVRTLCNKHHVALHRVFGKAPPVNSAERQQRWVDIQKNKFEGKIDSQLLTRVSSFFGAFT